MAEPNLPLTGPTQKGQGVAGQYGYWICMAHPSAETVEAQRVKTPDDFIRDTFRELIAEAHRHQGVELLESVCLLGPHASGKMHLNSFVRARRLYRWLRVAQWLLQRDKVHVGFGENIRTWPEGVVYI